ncbi:hypothetical protein MKX01_039522 [Papaver californicum]|nr:hypothetical protein MKX01_039522 [Papaver californicum]
MRLMNDFKSRVSSSIIYAVVDLVILALLVFEGSAYGGFWKAIHASERNDISDKTVLTIHCKSKDGDLGEHKLAYDEAFSWKFHQNFMRTKMFWCFMWWSDSTGKTNLGSYEVYKLKRDGIIVTHNARIPYGKMVFMHISMNLRNLMCSFLGNSSE